MTERYTYDPEGTAYSQGRRDGGVAGAEAERRRIVAMLKADDTNEVVAEALHESLRADPRFSGITPWAQCDDDWKDIDRFKARAACAALAALIEQQGEGNAR